MPKNKDLKSLEDGWQEINRGLVKIPIPQAHVDLLRFTFLAGCAFMMRQVSAIGQPGVTDEEAAEHYASMSRELDENALDKLLEIRGVDKVRM